MRIKKLLRNFKRKEKLSTTIWLLFSCMSFQLGVLQQQMALMNRLGLYAKQILKQHRSGFENKNITDCAMVKTLPYGALGAALF